MGKWLCAASWVDEIWSSNQKFDTREEAIEYGTEVCEYAKAKWTKEQGEDRSSWLAIEVFGDGEPLCDENDVYTVGCFDSFYVGQEMHFYPSIDGDNIIEQLACDADDIGGDCCEDWVNDFSRTDIAEIGTLLSDKLNEWLKANGMIPNFYSIINVEEIEVCHE